jgi:hypothetical protein
MKFDLSEYEEDDWVFGVTFISADCKKVAAVF